MMPLVDYIEMLGSCADGGIIDREEAARLLTEYSNGGLTLLGARDAIARHRTIRAEYNRIFRDASRMVVLLTAVENATDDQDRGLRLAAAQAETDQQLAEMRDEYRRRYGGGTR
jgi:hypothetical protein